VHHPRLLTLPVTILPVERSLHLQNAAHIPRRYGIRRDRLDKLRFSIP
jgi:hypothetical protein